MSESDKKREVPSLFDNLVTIEEFIKMTRNAYSVPTIYRWMATKGMPFRLIGRKRWIPVKEVELWIKRSS